MNEHDTSVYFRVGAGAVIHKDGKILVFKRADRPSLQSSPWQLPQGGLDRGEKIETGMWRELFEETALQQSDFSDVHEFPRWTVYLYGADVQEKLAKQGIINIGQSHRWWFLQMNDGVEINLDAAKDKEFTDYQWIDPDQLLDMAVDFKHETYTALLKYFQAHID